MSNKLKLKFTGIDIVLPTPPVDPGGPPVVETHYLTNLLRFNDDYILGSPTNPIETDLVIDYEGFTLGQTLITPRTLTIYHHNNVVPTFLSDFTITSGTYSTTYRTLNTIVITFYSLSNKTATIINTADSNGIHDIIPKRGLAWEGLRRNANLGYAPDTSTNPVHAYGSPYRMYNIIDNEGNVGFGINSTSSNGCFIIPKTPKTTLQKPFALSFWAKVAGNEHPFWHYTMTSPPTNSIRFFAVGYNADGGNGGNSFRLRTFTSTDHRIVAEFARGTSTDSDIRLECPADNNFRLNLNEYKHVFMWYDGTTIGITVNNQYTATKTNSEIVALTTNHNSDVYIGGSRNSHLNNSSWRTNKHYLRDFRWYNGYVPTIQERTQLYNHGLLQL